MNLNFSGSFQGPHVPTKTQIAGRPSHFLSKATDKVPCILFLCGTSHGLGSVVSWNLVPDVPGISSPTFLFRLEARATSQNMTSKAMKKIL